MKDENINETTINPAPEDEKPLVTFALFTYNQEGYIAEAIQGALSQTYSPLEIIISDDCSTDRTWEIVQREVANYTGPHKLVLNRNETNLGIGAHVNRVNELAQGELIVAAAGDDISLPNRVEELYLTYRESQEKYFCLFSDVRIIDENGHTKESFLPKIQDDQLTAQVLACKGGAIWGMSAAWTRSIFTFFGPMSDGVVFEDAVIPFRAALVGRVKFIDKPLVMYRRHANNVWKSGEDIHDAKSMIATLKAHAEGLLSVAICKLLDYKTAKNNGLINFIDESRVRKCLEVSCDVAQIELDLLRCKSPKKRLLMICKALLNGISTRKIARWVLLFFFPSLYFRFRVKRQ